MSWKYKPDDNSPFGQIAERVDMAEVYFEDGAPASAARCLREAADMAQAIADRRNAEIEKLIEVHLS